LTEKTPDTPKSKTKAPDDGAVTDRSEERTVNRRLRPQRAHAV